MHISEGVLKPEIIIPAAVVAGVWVAYLVYKLNFKDNLEKGLSAEEIIKNFFAQACDDISNNILNSMVNKLCHT